MDICKYILVRPQDLDEKNSKQKPVKQLLCVGYCVPSLEKEESSCSGILSNLVKEKIYTNNHILCEIKIRTECLRRL